MSTTAVRYPHCKDLTCFPSIPPFPLSIARRLRINDWDASEGTPNRPCTQSLSLNCPLMSEFVTKVHDYRPQASRPNLTDLTSVEKYVLPTSTYEALSNSVLAWKKNQKLGRFDPDAARPEEAMRSQALKDIGEVGQRGEHNDVFPCQLRGIKRQITDQSVRGRHCC